MTTGKKASVQGARRVTANLDNIASLFENHAASLGIPAKVAADFAQRCDLLSDAIERRVAGFYNPAQIGETVPGPLEMDPNNPFMNGEFTQQKFTELASKQMSGSLGSGVDPKLASLVAKEAGKLAFSILSERGAKTAGKPEKGVNPFPPKDEKKDEEDDESEKTASFFGLFEGK